jgi:hypothetical protein
VVDHRDANEPAIDEARQALLTLAKREQTVVDTVQLEQIDREGPGPQLRRSSADRWITVAPRLGKSMACGLMLLGGSYPEELCPFCRRATSNGCDKTGMPLPWKTDGTNYC